MTDQEIAPFERAARDLCKFFHTEEDCWPLYVPQVLAVLKAIREPSVGMIYAGMDYRPVNPETRAKDCWQAMIDAAILEKDNG
jgi:hypothetical protein